MYRTRMDEEEIERLIADLRELLEKHGFAWLLDEALAGELEEWSRHRIAHALIDAAEGVTVDLAEAELAALKALRVEEIDFKPDESELQGAVEGDRYPLRGPERRATLERQSTLRKTFAQLRERLDGDV